MAIQTIPGGLYLPLPNTVAGVGPAFATMATLDASGEKWALICEAPKSGNIRKIGFRLQTVTTGDIIDVRIETVDLANGDPSGTLFGTDTNVAHTITTGDANTWMTTAALTADAAVTQGDRLAIVFANGSTPGNAAYAGLSLSNRFRNTAPPYGDVFTTGAWVKSSTVMPIVALEYSDGTYEALPNIYPVSVINTISIASNTSGTTGDERGWKFQLPFSCRVNGGWAWVTIPGATDVDMVLYDSDGTTALATRTIDGNVDLAGIHVGEWTFSSSVTLLANTNYYLVMKPLSTTTMTMYDYTINSTSIRNACEGGANWNGVYRTDAGSWNDLTTTRMFMGLRMDGIDVSPPFGVAQPVLIGNRLQMVGY